MTQVNTSNRFRNFVYGTALFIMIGWVLYIAQNIFIPIIASIIVAYIIIALAQRMADIPLIGRMLPRPLRYTLSILIIILIISAFVILIISNINQVVALAPQYQARLLSIIQGFWMSFGEEFGVETAPTWETIRRDVFGSISLQSLIGSTVSSVSVIVGSVFVVIVYTGFALAERQLFERKIGRLSKIPSESTRIVEIVATINTRIGDYLATKTLVNLILGTISYAVMAFMDLDFAPFWAVLIALLNYIPYVGSFVGVLFPSAIGLVQYDDLGSVAGLFLGLTFCQILVGSLIEPSMMGRTLNLSPFVILVSLTAWGSLWGVAGALLSVPITAILVIILSEFDGTRPIAILLTRNGRTPHEDAPPKPPSSVAMNPSSTTTSTAEDLIFQRGDAAE